MATNKPNNKSIPMRNTRSTKDMNQSSNKGIEIPDLGKIGDQSENQCSSLVVDLNLDTKKKEIEQLSELYVDQLGYIHFPRNDTPLKLTLVQKILLLQNSEFCEEYEDIPMEEAVKKELLRILGSKDFAQKHGFHYSQTELNAFLKEEIFLKTTMKKHGHGITKLLNEVPSSVILVAEDLLGEGKIVIALNVEEPKTPRAKMSEALEVSSSSSPYSAGSWAKEMENGIEDVSTPPLSPYKEEWKLWSPGDSSSSS